MPLQLGTLSVPYTELVGDMSPGQGTFEWGGNSQWSLTIDLTGDEAWDNVPQALTDILGYSYVSGLSLVRNPPIRHPVYKWLSAGRCQVRGICFDPNTKGGKDKDPKGAYSTARYVRPRIEITFQAHNWAEYFEDDADEGDESQRYVEVKFSDASTSIQLEPGSMIYKEGNLPTDVPPGPKTEQVPFPLQKISQRAVLQLIWHQVPEDYLFGAAGTPSNFYGNNGTVALGGIGCVNATEFYGFAAGTLLLTSATFDRVQCPVPGAYNDQFSRQSLFYTVGISFSLFDPPLGLNATSRGHNTAPWRGDTLNRLCRSQFPTPTGNLLYTPYEMRSLFKCADAP